jgi:hypothetical protein
VDATQICFVASSRRILLANGGERGSFKRIFRLDPFDDAFPLFLSDFDDHRHEAVRYAVQKVNQVAQKVAEWAVKPPPFLLRRYSRP